MLKDKDTLTINVTQADIDSGCPGKGSNCPIALAVLRLLPTSTYIHVSSEVIVVSTENEVVRYEMPSEATVFVLGFDTEGLDSPHVHPFTFTARRYYYVVLSD